MVYTILFAKSWTIQTNQQRSVEMICEENPLDQKSMSFNLLPSNNNFDVPMKDWLEDICRIEGWKCHFYIEINCPP